MRLIGGYTEETGYFPLGDPISSYPGSISLRLSNGTILSGPWPGQTCIQCKNPLSEDVIALEGGCCVHESCYWSWIGMQELEAEGLA